MNMQLHLQRTNSATCDDLDCCLQQFCRVSSCHVMQVLSNMIDYGMEPQAALNAPRFSVEGVDSAYGPACVEYSK